MREGTDYYIEDGNVVFTSTYLLKRGYCCKSGCRHCPYREKNKSEKNPEEGKSDDRISEG
jgi:biotin synthase-like enzyme